jgi:hypothetical protein
MPQRRRWYAFIDGPQDHDGNREPFTDPGQALLWLAATIVFAVFWIALIALVFLLIPGSRVAAAGIAGLLLPAAGPLVLAAFIAATHASQDFARAIKKSRAR